MIKTEKQVIKRIIQIFKNLKEFKMALQNYYWDRKRIKDINKEKCNIGPGGITIGISDRCNYKCLFCYGHSPLSENFYLKNDQMDMETYCKLIDSLKKLKTKHVHISGLGEPLLNPNIIEMIAYTKKNDMFVSLTTNGSLLNPLLIKKLDDIGLNNINISLNAGTEKSHRIVHQTTNYFNSIKKNIELIASKTNIITSISFVLNKINFKEIKKMVELSIKMNVDYVAFKRLRVNKKMENLKIIGL